MLENHIGFADRNAFPAISTFFTDYDISAVVSAINCLFRADLGAFTALSAYFRFIGARFGEIGLDTQSRFSGIDILKILYGTDLDAQSASGAILRFDFKPLYFIHFGFHHQVLYSWPISQILATMIIDPAYK